MISESAKVAFLFLFFCVDEAGKECFLNSCSAFHSYNNYFILFLIPSSGSYIKDNNGEYHLSSGISRNEWSRQMPSFKKRFEQNSSYAKTSMETIFTKEMMEGATTLTCHEARSGYFENDGKGKFTFHPFPLIAQEAPVNAIACEDVNGDGFTDIIIAGNEYQANIMPGRYDASYGLLLTGNGEGDFTAVPPAKSGLILDGDVKDLKIISIGNQKILLAAINDAPMKAFAIKKK